jgi:RNA polymerase sigma factor (sigma-70 family)
MNRCFENDYNKVTEEKVFLYLFSCCESAIKDFLRNKLRNKVLEEDAFQETWLEYLKCHNEHKDTDIADFRKWILHVTKTKALMVLRTEKHHHAPTTSKRTEEVDEIINVGRKLHDIFEDLDERYVDYLSPEQVYEYNERIEEAREMLRTLPKSLKKIGWLHFVDGMNSREIAAMLEMKESTVQRYILRIPIWLKEKGIK